MSDTIQIGFELMMALVMAIVSVYDGIYNYTGNISQYSPGVMEVVLENHEIAHLQDDYDFFIAVLSCSHRGREATLVVDNYVYHGLVVDCANYIRFPETVFWMVNNNIIGEVSFEFASELGYPRRGFWADLTLGNYVVRIP